MRGAGRGMDPLIKSLSPIFLPFLPQIKPGICIPFGKTSNLGRRFLLIRVKLFMVNEQTFLIFFKYPAPGRQGMYIFCSPVLKFREIIVDGLVVSIIMYGRMGTGNKAGGRPFFRGDASPDFVSILENSHFHSTVLDQIKGGNQRLVASSYYYYIISYVGHIYLLFIDYMITFWEGTISSHRFSTLLLIYRALFNKPL